MSEIGWLAVTIILFWLTTLTVLIFKKNQKIISHSTTNPSDSQFNIGLVKFNPFSDTGGDQSFVVSLLNRHGSGILITSLHGRGITRMYAKKVTNGSCEQDLSAEEKQALSQALKN